MKYVAPALATVAAALGAFAEPISKLVAAHPKWAMVFGGLSAFLAAMAPQPQK